MSSKLPRVKQWICILLLSIPLWSEVVKTRLFEVTAPPDWKSQEARVGLFFLYPGQNIVEQELENVRILPSAISEGMSLDSYTYMAKFSVEREYPELSLSSSKPTQLGKLPAHRFEYRGLRGGKKFLLIQVMALHGNNGYTVEFFGSEANFAPLRNGFEQLLRSFKPL